MKHVALFTSTLLYKFITIADVVFVNTAAVEDMIILPDPSNPTFQRVARASILELYEPDVITAMSYGRLLRWGASSLTLLR